MTWIRAVLRAVIAIVLAALAVSTQLAHASVADLSMVHGYTYDTASSSQHGPIASAVRGPPVVRENHIEHARGSGIVPRWAPARPRADADLARTTYDPTGRVVSGRGGAQAASGSRERDLWADPGAAVAAETETSLYRGVATHHPGYEDAVQGVARPRGGPASALEHNLGDTRSEFTSWTTDPEVARGFAGNGVVLRVPMSSVRGQVVRSPDYFGESEVLLRGPVHGGEVLW